MTGGLSSLLYTELRDKKQLIYSIGSFSDSTIDIQEFGIQFNCKKNNKILDECLKNIDKELDIHRCDICPNDLKEYINGGYFNTENDELCTVLCLPIKIPLFFICILGSACNNCINCSFNTNRNYLL